MLEWLNRIRNFDPRKLTPTQIVLGIIAIIIIVAALNFVLQLANMLLPFAVIALLAYVGYQVLQSRSPDEATAEKPAAVASDNTEDRELEAQRDAAIVEETSPTRATVAPKINPDTGLEEADLEALLEKEKRLMAETKDMSDDIQAQIEARRQRLMNKNQSD